MIPKNVYTPPKVAKELLREIQAKGSLSSEAMKFMFKYDISLTKCFLAGYFTEHHQLPYLDSLQAAVWVARKLEVKLYEP